MIEITKFVTEYPGKRLVVLGSVHGDEHCGTTAIRRVVEEVRRNVIALQRGSLTVVPICNPQAHASKRRYIERNLNRSFMRRPEPTCYEYKLMNILCPLLEECDVLLDIHSFHAGGSPFAIRGSDGRGDEEEKFIRALGIEVMMLSGVDIYYSSGSTATEANQDASAGTTGYARKFGAIATTIECGGHDDPRAVDVAYRAIENALAFCELTATQAVVVSSGFKRIQMRWKQVRGIDQQFVKPWRHMDLVSAGETIARTVRGGDLKAPFDAHIIMPRSDCPIGEEFYFLGVDSDGTEEKEGETSPLLPGAH